VTGGYDSELRIWDRDRQGRPIVTLDTATA